ncbi:hypothetical protein [Dongia sp.]|uniref:hypothetical protein n=1 Tax=Dongia sp. TaxID=1977262 RepID=UPI0035AE86B0
MDIRNLNRADLLSVAERMRMADHDEIFATRFDDDPDALVDDLLAGDPLGVVFADSSGRPVAVLGATEMWPGLWSLWMFATDAWPRVAMPATRFARRRFWPLLKRCGLRRGECKSAAAHHAAHRWITHLGGRAEAVHPAFGRDGQDFITFVIHGEKDVCNTHAPAPADQQQQQQG